MKEKYVTPICEIDYFACADVITTSNSEDTDVPFGE